MRVSVVIPVYNEVQTIKEIVSRVQAIPLEKEIIIVDDCSTDGTREQLKEIVQGQKDIEVLFHSRNQGKGAALQTGFKSVTGDIVIIQDADLEYDPYDYHKLIEPITKNRADVVYGSRFLGNKSHRVLFFWHFLGNKLLTFISNIFTNLNLTDMEVGYKVFKQEILDKVELKEKRFGFEPEITAKISRLKCRIYEVGISYYGRTYDEGKKINWVDGLRALYVIVKYGIFK